MTDSSTPAPSHVHDRPSVLPWWVRALDVLFLVLVLVALSVALFGGFRVRLEDWRLSVLSPWRPLAAALIVAVLRLAFDRSEHLGRRLTRGWQRWRRDGAVRDAARTMLLVRVPIVLAAYFAVLILGYPGEKEPPFRVSPNEFINLPARWDAGWYLGIAADGYRPARAGVQQNIAFFPAYPMLMRAGGMLLGARSEPGDVWSTDYVTLTRLRQERMLLAGWLVSFLATFLALVYLHRFARDTLGGDSPAGAVLLISAYPFAYFFGAVYTEGLFLLGTVATLYHFRRHEYWRSALWGLLVGLTRPNGCLLSVPLAVMALQQSCLPRTLAAGDPSPRPGLVSFAKALAVAAMPGIGMVIFSAWLWSITGRPLAWMQAHGAWGRSFQSVGSLLGDRMQAISESGLYQYSHSQPVELLYIVSLVACLATLWPVARRLGWAYAVLILITVVPPLFAGGFLSMGRITSTLFPVFVYLGWRLSPERQSQVALFCMALQGALAALFFSWRPVF